MTHSILNQIANENGGGLSVAVTGKYTSIRHERAKIDGKLTAGEAAKYISKQLKVKISAKELVVGFKLLNGREPEWHHAGFYKNSSRKSIMGRTFFFDDSDVEMLIADWSKIGEKEAERKISAENKKSFEARKLEFLHGNAKKVERSTKQPMFFYKTAQEMNGKYGWFDSTYKSYNLPEYFSGWEFESEEKYHEFLNIK